MGKNRVTMSDIAEKLNISKNAVSLALNNKPGVSDALRRQIEATASEMNYKGLARRGAGMGKCIVVLTSARIRNDNFFYSDIFYSIEQEVKAIGATLVAINVSEIDERNLYLPAFPSEFNIIGALVIGAFTEKYIDTLSKQGHNLVSVDIPYNNVSISSVSSSNLSGAYLATKHLIEVGHTKIGFIGNIRHVQSVYERWCGFRQAMNESGIPIDNSYNIFGEGTVEKNLNESASLEPYFSNISQLPTAWFCAGDRIAFALINLITARGLAVPDNISVVGFDDISFAKLFNPPLTTIKTDRRKMGKIAVNMLINTQSIGGVKEIIHVSLPSSLIKRNSVLQNN